MLRRLAVVGAVAMVAACSTAVGGHGSLDRSLHCPAGSITAHGAPFCYRLPDGFTDNSTLTSYAAGWKYRTLVSVGQYDLVEVLAAPLPFDSDTNSDSKLRDYARVLLAQVVEGSRVTETGVTPTRVAGVRAYEQTVTLRNGATERSILAYRGRTEVYIQCEHRDKVAAARDGCATVLGTLQIVALSG